MAYSILSHRGSPWRDKFYEFGQPFPPRSCCIPQRLLDRVITLHQAGVTQDKHVEGEGGADK